MHRRIIELVAPQPGERFLDLACGTGGVALIAARTGADVTGLDISADQLEKARAAAAEAGLEIRFDEGDAQALPYEDASYDAVVSAFGMIFAPDHQQAADELTRVSKPGARVAVTSWPNDEWAQLGARLRPQLRGHRRQAVGGGAVRSRAAAGLRAGVQPRRVDDRRRVARRRSGTCSPPRFRR